MTPAEILAYIQFGSQLINLGVEIGGKFRDLIALFHPDHTLTEEQINAIEAAAVEDDHKRAAERIAMLASN